MEVIHSGSGRELLLSACDTENVADFGPGIFSTKNEWSIEATRKVKVIRKIRDTFRGRVIMFETHRVSKSLLPVHQG